MTQDTLYSNRGLCYLSMKKNRQAINDLNKAITLNTRNVKALKRLAFVLVSTGELAEAELYLKRCEEIEPEDASHKEDVKNIRNLILNIDELNKAKFVLDFKKTEKLAAELLNHINDLKSLKLTYVESLLQNCKTQEAMKFIKRKLSDEERNGEEFQYLYCMAYYHDGN